jgi:hypothetical protein
MNKEIATLISTVTAGDFLSFKQELSGQHQTLTGCGVDYTQGEVSALKIYHKVFCKDFSSISFFTDWFLRDLSIGGDSIDRALRRSSRKLLTSKGGLGGINFAVKIPRFGKSKKAIYIKQRGGAVRVLNFDRGIINSVKYKYLFNRFLIKLFCRYFNLNLPENPHGIEYSRRGRQMNCSIYPNYKLNEGKLIDFLSNMYINLKKHDAWSIEDDITSSFQEIMPELMPITKGYCSEDSSRKIFLGIKSDIS